MIFDPENKYLNVAAILLFVAILVTSFFFLPKILFKQVTLNYTLVEAFVNGLDVSLDLIYFNGTMRIGEDNTTRIDVLGRASGNMSKKAAVERLLYPTDVCRSIGGEETSYLSPFSDISITCQNSSITSFSSNPSYDEILHNALTSYYYTTNSFEWS